MFLMPGSYSTTIPLLSVTVSPTSPPKTFAVLSAPIIPSCFLVLCA